MFRDFPTTAAARKVFRVQNWFSDLSKIVERHADALDGIELGSTHNIYYHLSRRFLLIAAELKQESNWFLAYQTLHRAINPHT
jgi:hypothetical protein